jgi:DNA polymerase-3 subunit beta
VGVRCCAEAKVLEEGATTLPAKTLAPLIKELDPQGHIELTTNANDLTEIKCGSSKFKLRGMSRLEYPALPSLEGASHFQIPQKDLREAFFTTSFAVSRDDTRYILTGVNMSIDGTKATFMGTDGKRLARSFFNTPVDGGVGGSYTIPAKAVDEVLKALNEEGNVDVYLMEDKIALQTKNTLVISKLLSGEYPEVTRVIPEQSSAVVSLHREELMSLLRQMMLFTTEQATSARFSFQSGELFLDINSSSVGEGKVSMPVNYSGEPLEIAFNASYFYEILRHCSGETVSLGLIDSFNPGVIADREQQPTIAAGASPLFILMPMRLNEEG